MEGIFLVQPKRHPRIPSACDGIQVNHCKNVHCANFGVVPPETRGAAGLSPDKIGAYTVIGSQDKHRYLTCHLCRRSTTLRSNAAIVQELARFDPLRLRMESACCPNTGCSSFGLSVLAFPKIYYLHGQTKTGAMRYRCRECRATFSVGAPIRTQRRPELTEQVLKLLVNKVPMRRMCEILTMNPATLYNKIGYLAEVAAEISAHYEAKLTELGVAPSRAYVSVDRQDYVLNWGTQLDRRNIMLGALGAVENKSGYVLAMQLNFDPSCNAEDIEADAITRGDYDLPLPHRHYARQWLRQDYREITKRPDEIVADTEVSEQPSAHLKLPHSGMQIHLEYTQHALFLHLKRLLHDVERVRIFMDRDPGLDGACIAAFVDDIRQRRVDVFRVQSPKNLTMAKKKVVIAQFNRELDRFRERHPDVPNDRLRHHYVRYCLDAWHASPDRTASFHYPLADMAEPGKEIEYLTDFGDMDLDHLANLYMRVSLRGIDRFFMQVRRRLSILERPIATANNAGRTWHGYAAYSPLVAERMLRIFRTHYNFALIGEDGATPAMRFGLADQPVLLADLATFPRTPAMR